MTTSKKWVTICVAAGLIAACTLAAPPSASAAFTETKNSADFDRKYEMTTLMPSEEDLDTNGTMDFRYKSVGAGSASIIEGGLLHMVSTGSTTTNMYFGNHDNDGRIWMVNGDNYTFAGGYTIEASIKVLSSTGTLGAWCIHANAVDESRPEARLNISDTGLFWGTTPIGGTVDNTDDFHVFRIAQEEGQDNFRVWRDGNLLGEYAAPVAPGTGYLYFGDPGSSDNRWVGEVEVDYFRFIKGAYSPGDTLPPIPGDANLDNVVNDQDASILAAHWQYGPDAVWGDGDFNDDGVVNDEDASILAAHWQESREGTTPVPEPSSVVLLLCGLVSLLLLARRRSCRIPA